MSTTTNNFGLIKPELTDPADITAMNENWDKIDSTLGSFTVTLSGDATNGYSCDKSFTEIAEAYNAGKRVVLIEHSYGSIVEYKLQYVYDDQIDFSYHKALNNRVIEVYSWGTVTKKSYQYFSDINPPTCSTIGASPVGHTHSTIVEATLPTSGWSDGVQTITVSGVKNNSCGDVYIAPTATEDEFKAFNFAQLHLTAQSTDSITLTVRGTVPTIDIPIEVEVRD